MEEDAAYRQVINTWRNDALSYPRSRLRYTRRSILIVQNEHRPTALTVSLIW